jgi:uncharacterized protein YndB with AHSA1/START domain
MSSLLLSMGVIAGCAFLGATGASADDAATGPIEVERVVGKPPEEVWRLWTTSAGWKQFFGVDAQIEMRIGGKWEIYFDSAAPAGSRGSEGCTVQTLIPGRLIAFSWNAPPQFQHARMRRTWVAVEISPDHAVEGGGNSTMSTRVHLTHLGFAEQSADNPDHSGEWAEVREYFSKAWPKVLDALAR